MTTTRTLVTKSPVRSWNHPLKGRITGIAIDEGIEWTTIILTEASRGGEVGTEVRFLNHFTKEAL